MFMLALSIRWLLSLYFGLEKSYQFEFSDPLRLCNLYVSMSEAEKQDFINRKAPEEVPVYYQDLYLNVTINDDILINIQLHEFKNPRSYWHPQIYLYYFSFPPHITWVIRHMATMTIVGLTQPMRIITMPS